jgi:dihydrofolate reductase
MRKVHYFMSVSLDGFIETADGDISFTNPDEELDRHIIDRESGIDLYLYGRRLYEIMASFWPTADEAPNASEFEKEYARLWKPKPKIVFSTTLDHVEWNSRLVRGNIAEEVDRLKEQPGKDMNVAGPGIAATFMQLGLIDEYWLYVHPIVLGGGKPYFPPLREKIALQLVETHTFGRGVVLLRYQLAGAHP